MKIWRKINTKIQNKNSNLKVQILTFINILFFFFLSDIPMTLGMS